jgi:hypothetical protein
VLAVVLAACGDEETEAPVAAPPDTGAVAPGPTVPLSAWVDKMVADEEQPDTVDDKIGVVIDTDDQTAFDKFLR